MADDEDSPNVSREILVPSKSSEGDAQDPSGMSQIVEQNKEENSQLDSELQKTDEEESSNVTQETEQEEEGDVEQVLPTRSRRVSRKSARLQQRSSTPKG